MPICIVVILKADIREQSFILNDLLIFFSLWKSFLSPAVYIDGWVVLSLSDPLRFYRFASPVLETVSDLVSRKSWARLIQKIYKVDPLICEECGHEMELIAVITSPHKVRKILECLKRNHAPPFDKITTKTS